MSKTGIDDYIAAGYGVEDLAGLPRVEFGAEGQKRAESQQRTGGSPPRLELAPEALYGLAGEIVRAIDPYTEAAPVATLIHFLVGVGNLIGPGPHARVQHDHHPPRLFVALVGRTSRARKGLAWSTPRELLARVDGPWAQRRIRPGLSTGEGLIYHVRDPQDGRGSTEPDPGEPDKRLLVVEPELAVVLKRMGLEGNSLSGVMRQGWDSGDLSTLTKNSPLRATGAHVSIISHITAEEVRRYLTETERANGFANRFLWVWVERSKLCPEGEPVPEEVLAPLVEELRLRRVVDFARTVGEIRRDEQASAIWAEVYPRLTQDVPGLLGAIISRAEAQVLRLSVDYALLDCSPLIRPPHLQAALAVWEYAEASARRIFGDATGNPVADRILRVLRTGGEMTETAIRDLFKRNVAGRVIDEALELLYGLGLVQYQVHPSGGRPMTVWRATT